MTNITQARLSEIADQCNPNWRDDGLPVGSYITPQLSVKGITRLNTIVTILTDCLQTCKNGNVKVRKGRAKLYSQAMLRLAEMSDNQIETLEKSKKIT